jgi:uncharacterized LabA/DUF88 family protein
MTDAPQPVPADVPPPSKPPRKRSIIYIDGFNFYYGLLHERPDHKWLNYCRLAELLRPDDDILRVNLFTALVDADLHMSEKRDRQKRLFHALGTQPKLELVYGKFASRERECLVYSCPHRRKFWALEEKQTDVNMAISMIRDASTIRPQVMVLITGDIDLVPALNEVKRLNRSTHLVIYVPAPQEELKHRRKDEFGKFGLVQPIPATRGLMPKSSAMLRAITPRFRAVGLPLPLSIRCSVFSPRPVCRASPLKVIWACTRSRGLESASAVSPSSKAFAASE